MMSTPDSNTKKKNDKTNLTSPTNNPTLTSPLSSQPNITDPSNYSYIGTIRPSSPTSNTPNFAINSDNPAVRKPLSTTVKSYISSSKHYVDEHVPTTKTPYIIGAITSTAIAVPAILQLTQTINLASIALLSAITLTGWCIIAAAATAVAIGCTAKLLHDAYSNRTSNNSTLFSNTNTTTTHKSGMGLPEDDLHHHQPSYGIR